MHKDLYKTLGIHHRARGDEIKKAFRQVALQHHPDRNFQDLGAEERFKEANYAYSILGDEEKRKRYDLYREFRKRSDHLGFSLPPSPVYEKALEDFFLKASLPGFAAGMPLNMETLAGIHPVFSASRNSLLFMKRLVRALRDEKIFPPSRARPSRFRSGIIGRKSLWRSKRGNGSAGPVDGNPTPRADVSSTQPVSRRAERSPGGKAGDIQWTLPLSAEEAQQGTVLTVSLPCETSWERVHLRVPPGVRDGTRLRVRNKGTTSPEGRELRGDLYLRIRVN